MSYAVTFVILLAQMP